MLRSTISNNSATAGDTGLVADGGGGIFSINNTFTLRDSTVQNNISFRDGGGITLAPIFFPSTPMKIERTLIAGNSAQNDGGGVFITGKNGGSALIDNSTVSGNQSSRLGGGISAELLPLDKPLVLNAVTIAGNTAPGFNGGGLAASGSPVQATNVILANNLGGNCFFTTFENSRFNISSDNFLLLQLVRQQPDQHQRQARPAAVQRRPDAHAHAARGQPGHRRRGLHAPPSRSISAARSGSPSSGPAATASMSVRLSPTRSASASSR